MLEGGGRIGAGVKKNIWVDYWIFGEIVIIGLAEMVHLITMVLGWTFERCSLVFMGTAGFLGIQGWKRKRDAERSKNQK